MIIPLLKGLGHYLLIFTKRSSSFIPNVQHNLQRLNGLQTENRKQTIRDSLKAYFTTRQTLWSLCKYDFFSPEPFSNFADCAIIKRIIE